MIDNQFDFMFKVFPSIFIVFFIVFIAIFIVSILRGVTEWTKNNHQPLLAVEATVVTKRTHTSHHNHEGHSTDSTSYYVTFEVESGDRMEFHVSGREFGQLAEGDLGKLSFQGTRYKGFERQKAVE